MTPSHRLNIDSGSGTTRDVLDSTGLVISTAAGISISLIVYPVVGMLTVLLGDAVQFVEVFTGTDVNC
jgi:hypothetical protein